jgi:hypothetical protein
MLIATDHVDPHTSPASSEEEFVPADPDPDDLTDSSGDLSPLPAHALATTHDDITYDHQAAHSAANALRDAAQFSSANDALQSLSSSNDRDVNLASISNSRMSF